MISIWWIRRDIRLQDNLALQAALESESFLPVYILDPYLLDITPANKKSFLYNGLEKLGADLRRRGSYLVIRKGNPAVILQRLVQEINARVIFAEEDYTPYARRRDKKIAQELPLELIQGQLVHHPMAVLKSNGSPYSVFTPFCKSWKSLLPSTLDPLSAPEFIPPPPRGIKSEVIPVSTKGTNFPSGSVEAYRRLYDFINTPSPEHGVRVYSYEENRNRLDLDGTSVLSPYIHFGTISLRETVDHARIAIDSAPAEMQQKGAVAWLNELIWREFYIHILYHFPRVRGHNFRKRYDHFRWVNNMENFNAWKKGETGYPVVDAAMRQMLATGWMHNRARMIVASFLVKHLLIDWRWGERWFMKNLLDGDLAANNGGWQWTAGTGTDAAPYFRIFNPILQSKKFDPNGDYIRRWVPELSHMDTNIIHAPWEKGGDVPGYPEPIVDHKFARERALAAYQDIRR